MSELNQLQKPVMRVLTLSEGQIATFTKEWNIAAFYAVVAAVNELEMNEEDLFDCRKIKIAKNILEYWENQFAQKYGESRVYELYMYLVDSGPKTDSTLAENEVSILDGFVFVNEAEKVIKQREKERLLYENNM